MEKKYIRAYRFLTLIFSSLLIVLIFSAWIKESYFIEWKKYQHAYKGLKGNGYDSITREQDLPGIEMGIRQIGLKTLGRVDRCISCHLGLEDPAMRNAAEPHRFHVGEFLVDHPQQRFGCTICHGGQGRALTKDQAFGRNPDTYWPYPLLDQPYIQSSCGKCHLAIFASNNLMPGTEVFYKGQEIFRREGCLGCHKARGLGGTVGPDLTEQGEKTKHQYNFQNIKGEQTISNWLKEHFRNPEMVSPGSQMLKIDLPEEELESLVTFTMGLAKPDIPFDYFTIETLAEFKGDRPELGGKDTWSFCCSACHGRNGEGKSYEEYLTGIPTLGSEGFLAVASDELIRFTLHYGRGGRQMASWFPEYSGMFLQEFDSLVNHIRERKQISSSFEQVVRLIGNAAKGMELYNVECLMCHGKEGSGGVGLAICNSGFMRIASDVFIYSTIRNGRYNSAMPSWSWFSDQDMADMLALLRSWGGDYQPYFFPRRLAGDSEQGALQYHYLCSRCHGEFGEGETGPAILNKDFLEAAKDEYLYQTIAFGRAHTAMFGWKGQIVGQGKIDDREILNIITYMRMTWQEKWDYIYAGVNPGDASAGRGIYLTNCARCHGQEGEGIKAPQLNSQEFLNAATNGYIIATVSIGRKGTKMPSWGKGSIEYSLLTGKERQDVASYIRSWQRVMIKQ